MERPRHHLIPPLLLLVLLAGAAATIGADAQPCESTHLATQIALFCASGLPTAPCCEPVVASVDRGGGVPCLCRVAAQPQVVFVSLNASHLVSLYIACGGLYTDGAHFAAACCLGSPPLVIPVIAPPPAVPLREQQSRTPPSNVPVITPPEVVPLRKQQTRTNCNWTLLAFELTQYCRDDMGVPSPRCCRSVLMTIDDQDPDCLCRVVEAGDMVVSGFLDVWVMWDFYKECGGRKQAVPKDKENCSHVPSPSPPPPPPSPPQLSPPPPVPKTRHQLRNWEVAVIVVVSVVGVVATLTGVARLIRKKVKPTKAKEHELSRRNRDQQEKKSEEESEEDEYVPDDSETLQARQHARQLARDRELDQDIGMLPKRAPPQSQPEKQRVLVRVHNSSDTDFDREAEFNW